MGQHYLHIKSLSEQESLSLLSPVSLILKHQLVYILCLCTECHMYRHSFPPNPPRRHCDSVAQLPYLPVRRILKKSQLSVLSVCWHQFPGGHLVLYEMFVCSLSLGQDPVKITYTPLATQDWSYCILFSYCIFPSNVKCNLIHFSPKWDLRRMIICSDKFVKALNISTGTSTKNYDDSVSISAKWFHFYEKMLQFFMTADNNDERHTLCRGWSAIYSLLLG